MKVSYSQALEPFQLEAEANSMKQYERPSTLSIPPPYRLGMIKND